VVAPEGTVMTVSKGFKDKTSAVAGIRDVREYAGTALISDACPNGLASAGPAGAAAHPQRKPVSTAFVSGDTASMRPVGFM